MYNLYIFVRGSIWNAAVHFWIIIFGVASSSKEGGMEGLYHSDKSDSIFNR